MKKATDVTLGRGVVFFAAMVLAVAVQLVADKHDLHFVFRLIAWALIGLAAMTCWHYQAIRRRPALFYSFLGVDVVLALLAFLGYVLPPM